MHGEECRADLCDAFDALLDRIADVVQLEIDENLFALADQLAGKFKASGKAKLVADLVKRDGVVELRDQAARCFG